MAMGSNEPWSSLLMRRVQFLSIEAIGASAIFTVCGDAARKLFNSQWQLSCLVQVIFTLIRKTPVTHILNDLLSALGGAAGYMAYEQINPKEQWRNIMILTGPPGAGKGSQVPNRARRPAFCPPGVTDSGCDPLVSDTSVEHW